MGAKGGSPRVGPTPARSTSPALLPAGSLQTEDVEPMEIEDLPAFEFSRPSPSPPPAAVCAVSSEAALGGSVASASVSREEKRPRSRSPRDDEEDEDVVAEEPPLPCRLSPREKLKIRLGLCNPEEQRDWMEGRKPEEIARLQRDPEPNDLATARAWGFLDVFDSNGFFVRVAMVKEKRKEIFQQWKHRCREAIRSLSPTGKSDRSSPERTDSKVSRRGEREAGDGSYLGFKSGFLSSSGSSGKGDPGRELNLPPGFPCLVKRLEGGGGGELQSPPPGNSPPLWHRGLGVVSLLDSGVRLTSGVRGGGKRGLRSSIAHGSPGRDGKVVVALPRRQVYTRKSHECTWSGTCPARIR